MIAYIDTRITYVWLLLVVITCISWGLADGYQAVDITEGRLVSSLLIVLAFFKARLVIMHFMEIAAAPLALRAVFELWCVFVCFAILAMLLNWISI